MAQLTYYRWGSPRLWFGTTFGCSLWIGISAGMLAAWNSAAEGVILAGLFLAVMLFSTALWRYRGKVSAYAAWQLWLAFLWIASLSAVAVLQWTDTYGKVNLDVSGMLVMWIGVGVGVPLLMLDFYARQKSDGKRGAFGAAFDFFAGFF